MLEEITPGSVIEFDYILPVGDEILGQQVADNLKRDIPDAVPRRKLTIIADGPSANDVDIRKIDGPILAVNRAINLFTAKGTSPTYWAACDAQELVARFLPERPPQETIYYVSSNCHPSVFQKLKNNRVELWHIGDHPGKDRVRIPQAIAVTVSTVWLMVRLGFTDFEFWGWDGCFMDGKHHASNSDDWSKVPTITLNYGGKEYTTTHAWAAEAQSAEQFFLLAEYFDIGVKINGDGMFECARKFLKAA